MIFVKKQILSVFKTLSVGVFVLGFSACTKTVDPVKPDSESEAAPTATQPVTTGEPESGPESGPANNSANNGSGSESGGQKPALAVFPRSSEIRVDLLIKVADNTQLTPDECTLLDSINHKQSANFDLISTALIDLHSRARAAQQPVGSEDGSRSQFEKLVQTQFHAANPYDLKIKYEGVIESALSKSAGATKKIQYSATSTNVFDVLSGTMQCYSGTILNTLVTRYQTSVEDFEKAENIVIVRPGHVLPGYAKKNAKNEWEIFGIETTVSGEGKIAYGVASTLGLPMRIVGANDFAVFQIFERHLTGLERDQLMQKALQNAAERYGLDLALMEVLVQLENEKSAGQPDASGLNATTFGFGVANTPKGVVDRSTEPTEVVPEPAADDATAGMNPLLTQDAHTVDAIPLRRASN